MNFLSFLSLFFILLNSRAVVDHQMYSGGSIVGETSTIGIETSPTPPLIFTAGVKSVKFGVVFNITEIYAARV